jgi:tetratricopeptide (TPR) repeat protein
MTSHPCPRCSEPAAYSKKRGQYVCLECDVAFGSVAKASSVPPTLATKTLKVFLSYGRDDHVAEVKALRDALRARGHEVWFDEEQLGTGLDWEQRIEAGLAWCDRVVLTMTPHSVRRPDGYCLNEIAKALELRKLIIPVLLVEVPQGAPTSICRIQYLDWRDAVPAAEKAERFTQRLTRLCEAIEEDKLDFEGGQQRLIRHLQPLNFDGDIQRHVASFRGRVQLEARLRQWLADPQGSQVLWLTAAPGLGKSALAATLSHRWAEVGAVHFCVAGHQDKANPASAVLSIAYQLSQHLDLYLVRLVNLELERETQKDARTLFDILLVGPLAKNYPAPPTPLVVILDGLDEATQAGGENPLAQIVAAGWGRLPPWLRLMVSSRPEAELVTWLAGTQRIEIRGFDAEQRDDLAAFLRDRLTAIGRLPGEDTLKRIVERSEGAFHYAVLLIEEVRQGRCDPDNPVDLPAGLNPFYLQTFKRRFPDITAYRSQTRPLLELILAAPEPIPLTVLAGATKREAQDVRQDLSTLGSMLAIEPGQGETDPDWHTVRLSHASLRSWLTRLDATRQPLAGAFAAKVNTQGLAEEVLRLWEAGNDLSKDYQDYIIGHQWLYGQQKTFMIGRKGFVARTLWGSLKAARNEAAMQRVAFDLSLYWGKKQLALAIEPGDFSAQEAWRGFETGAEDPATLLRSGSCLIHLGELQKAVGQSTHALQAFRKSLRVFERLCAQDPKHEKWQKALCHSYNRIGGVLEERGDLGEAAEIYGKYFDISERMAEQHKDDAVWRENVGAGYSRIGKVLWARGKLADALDAFRAFRETFERLTTDYPDNADWQRSLAVSHNHVGVVLEAQGDTARAMVAFRNCQDIIECLSTKDPDNPQWQLDLALSHSRIGGALQSQSELAGALKEFTKSLIIAERLAAQDPHNAIWQRALGVGYHKVGGVLRAQGDLAGALEEFRKHQTICERLAAQDPHNAGWQHDLAVSFYKTGKILEQLADFAAAADLWRRELLVREGFAKLNEDSSSVADEIASCHNRIGGALQAAGDYTGARESFGHYLQLSHGLLDADPGDSTKQRNVAIGHASVAAAQLALKRVEDAKSSYAQARPTLKALRDAEDAGAQFDWAAITALGAEIALAEGDAQCAASHRQELTGVELDPEGLGGRFRKRFLPLILKHLEATTQDADPQHRALVTLRVLRLVAKAPAIDLSTWRERARELLQQLLPEEALAGELREFVP